MYITFERVTWIDKHFNLFSTIIVCGLFYTFVGEIKNEMEVIYSILDRIESYEEDNAAIEMSSGIGSILYKNQYETDIMLN